MHWNFWNRYFLSCGTPGKMKDRDHCSLARNVKALAPLWELMFIAVIFETCSAPGGPSDSSKWNPCKCISSMFTVVTLNDSGHFDSLKYPIPDSTALTWESHWWQVVEHIVYLEEHDLHSTFNTHLCKTGSALLSLRSSSCVSLLHRMASFVKWPVHTWPHEKHAHVLVLPDSLHISMSLGW